MYYFLSTKQTLTAFIINNNDSVFVHCSNANIMETPAIISMNWLLKVYRSHSHFLKPMEKLVEEPDNLPMTEIHLYY